MKDSELIEELQEAIKNLKKQILNKEEIIEELTQQLESTQE